MGLRDKAKQNKVVENPVEGPAQQTSTPKATSDGGKGLRDRAKALTKETSISPTASNTNGTGKLQREELISHIMRNKLEAPEADAPSPNVAKDVTLSEAEESPNEPEKAKEEAKKIGGNREVFIKGVADHRKSANLVREAYGIQKPQKEGLPEGEESTEVLVEDEPADEYKEQLFDRIVKSADSRDVVFEFASKHIRERKLQEITEAVEAIEYPEDPDDPEDAEDAGTAKLSPEKQAVFELMEEQAADRISSRLRKIQEQQRRELDSKQVLSFSDKIKNLIAREAAEIEPYNIARDGPLTTFPGVPNYKELTRYWVYEPYCFIVILNNPEKNEMLYYVAEPNLSSFEETFLEEIRDRLRDVLLVEDTITSGKKEDILHAKVRNLIKDYAIEIDSLMLEKIMYYIVRDFVGFGKIDALMRDNHIEDISGNGFDRPIYLYHREYRNIPTNISYPEDELNSFIIRLAQRSGKHISVADPIVDSTLHDGSRVQMTLGKAVTAHGSTFTIRRFSEVPLTPIDLIGWHTFSTNAMAYLWLCIENNNSLIFSGGTASGKTTSLNAVSLFIPPNAKIISLEDTRELQLPHPNWIPSTTRDSFTADERGAVDMYELLKAALRQRPEYLLVGEVRGKEALTLFQAMSTGHTTFSTMHADSVSSAIHRLENPPISVPRSMIEALNIMSIQAQTYYKGKRVRRNLKLVEIIDIDPNTRNIRTNDIFVWDAATDKFNRVGDSKALTTIKQRRGMTQAQLDLELGYREKVLDYMVVHDIRDFNAVATIIQAYMITPDKVLKKLKIIE